MQEKINVEHRTFNIEHRMEKERALWRNLFINGEFPFYPVMRSDSGVTLLEMLVTISIIGVIFAIAIPNFISGIPESKVNGAARALFTDLQLARMKAIAENRVHTVTFDIVGNSYSILIDNELIKTVEIGKDFPEIAYGYLPGKNPMGTTITKKVTFSGSTPKMAFKPTGSANKAGSIYLMPVNNTDAKKELQRVITVIITGRIRLYKHNGTGWE